MTSFMFSICQGFHMKAILKGMLQVQQDAAEVSYKLEISLFLHASNFHSTAL